MARNKPGVGMLKKIAAQEEKHKHILVELERRKIEARERVTGKTRARGYVRKWLEALSTGELREEVELRGHDWHAFEDIDHAVRVVLANMFEEMTPEEEASLLEAACSDDEEEGISGIIEGMDDPDEDGEEGVG